MQFYIAAKYSARNRIKAPNDQLEELGFRNSYPWFSIESDEQAKRMGSDIDSLGTYSKEEHASMTEQELIGIRYADIFILDTFDETKSGGREVELGYALALNLLATSYQYSPRTGSISIFQVGPIRNVFHMHRRVEHWTTWGLLIEHLRFIYIEMKEDK